MAVTALTTYKDNTYQSVNLISVHNPLCFMVDVDYTGSAPDNIQLEILDDTDTVIGEAVFHGYEDIQSGKRRYYALLEQYLRSYINDFSDFEQTAQTLEHVANMTKYLKCRFYYQNSPGVYVYSSYFCLIIGNMSSQIGELEAQSDIYNNENELIIGYYNKPLYVYFYNNSTTNTIALPV